MNKRSNCVVALGLLAGLVLAGCGGGASSTAPEDTVPPAPVVGVEAVGIDSASPVVILVWEAGSEADLAGYMVYRIVGGGSPELVGAANGDRWMDRDVVTDVDLVYQVAAVDVSENESARSSSNTVVVRVDPGSGKDEVD